MKFSLIYLGAAVAAPLISYVIQKISESAFRTARLPYFRVVHELEGRIRYTSELMKDRDFCLTFDEKLKSFPGITSVRSNHLTGTVLITHVLEKKDIRSIFEYLNRDLKKSLSSQKTVSCVSPEKLLLPDTSENESKASTTDQKSESLEDNEVSCRMNFPSSGFARQGRNRNSMVRDSFFDNMSVLSRKINVRTAGYFDLASLIGLILILRGLYKILKLGQLPNGPQLLWWGYSLFKTRDLNVKTLPLHSQNSR